ncbi:OppA family ABC transporter substrate-binding lipoprotein [Mycoplasmopsis iners]|uniref:OppA family ABC transporter substrate-binding lipoprotein n=1 Tax=Mycoplasmopsis iners TaxID=76630 RepID=UPI000496937C|nr:hypothetical protein [Mycoplasmopsis iners]
MNKIFKLSLISSLTTLPLIATACNIREASSSKTYIKEFNSANPITNNYLINKVKRVETDYEALLHSPLIRWEFNGKAKYDSLNKTFFKVSTKHLSFGLASRITLTLKDNSVYVYDSDEVDNFVLSANDRTGIKQIYSENERNINSQSFFNNLSKAKSISFSLKQAFYVHNNSERSGDFIAYSDYWRSLQNDWDNSQNLFANYAIKQPNITNFATGITFELLENSNTNLASFTLEEIPNNLIFNPMPFYESSENLRLEDIKFASPYLLAYNSFDKQIFHKNEDYPVVNFKISDYKLEEVILKYNPVPIDISTYQLQLVEAFKQNLISEADFNLLNSTQQNEINNNTVIYGLNYFSQNNSFTNGNKYLINLESLQTNNPKYNNAFKKAFFGDLINGEINQLNLNFRNLLSMLINPYALQKINNFDNYWNSLSPQNLVFDAIDSYQYKSAKIAEFEDYINNLYFENTSTNDLIFVNKYDFEKQYQANVLNLEKALQNPKIAVLKAKMKNILDQLYTIYSLDSSEILEWEIPVFEEESYQLKQLFDWITNIYRNLDSRLKPTFKFVEKNDNSYYLKYFEETFYNSSFSNYIFSLLSNKNIPLLTVLKVNMKQDANSILFDKTFTSIQMLIDILSKTTHKNIKEITIEDITNYKNELVNILQSLKLQDQLSLIKAIDLIFSVQANTSAYSLINQYSKQIVQIQFEKPLNDVGYTQYQDINVLI